MAWGLSPTETSQPEINVNLLHSSFIKWEIDPQLPYAKNIEFADIWVDFDRGVMQLHIEGSSAAPVPAPEPEDQTLPFTVKTLPITSQLIDFCGLVMAEARQIHPDGRVETFKLEDYSSYVVGCAGAPDYPIQLTHQLWSANEEEPPLQQSVYWGTILKMTSLQNFLDFLKGYRSFF